MGDEQLRAGQQAVTAVMKACPPPIPPDLPLHEVFLRFSKEGNRPLVVTGPGGVFAGVITPMDIVEAISSSMGLKNKRMISGFERFLKGTAQTAGDLIADERIIVRDHARITEVISVMERTRSSFIIVVNEQNSAIGCVELSDIIAYGIQSGFW
jgi:CBS domain containing-hemolysin-like protein